MKDFLKDYISQQKNTLDTIPLEKVSEIVSIFREALRKDQQIFVFGNGGSAANASHFVTDLGKGSSDKTSRRFRCMSINDNTAWITALGNDYSYDEIFTRQLMNFAKKGDIVFCDEREWKLSQSCEGGIMVKGKWSIGDCACRWKKR